MGDIKGFWYVLQLRPRGHAVRHAVMDIPAVAVTPIHCVVQNMKLTNWVPVTHCYSFFPTVYQQKYLFNAFDQPPNVSLLGYQSCTHIHTHTH